MASSAAVPASGDGNAVRWSSRAAGPISGVNGPTRLPRSGMPATCSTSCASDCRIDHGQGVRRTAARQLSRIVSNTGCVSGDRAADDLQHLARRRLLLQRLLGLVEQPHVLDRDHRPGRRKVSSNARSLGRKVRGAERDRSRQCRALPHQGAIKAEHDWPTSLALASRFQGAFGSFRTSSSSTQFAALKGQFRVSASQRHRVAASESPPRRLPTLADRTARA